MKLTGSPTEPTPQSPGLPPYLQRIDPMAVEDLPLQVSLLTMEVATLRTILQRMAVILDTASRMMTGPGLDLDDHIHPTDTPRY